MKTFLTVFLLIILVQISIAITINVGVILPITGDASMDGIPGKKAIILANELFNKIGNYTIKIIIKDQKSDPLSDKKITLKLIKDYKVKALIGWFYSSHALGGTPVAEEYKVPGICIYATNPLITKGKNYISRVVFDDNLQAKAAATYMYNNLRVRKIAVIRDISQEYSIGLSSIFESYFRKLGGKIIRTYNINSRSTRSLFLLKYTTQQILKDNVKNLYIPIYSKEVAEILLFLRFSKKHFLFFSSDSSMYIPDFLENNVSLCDNLYYTDQYYPNCKDENNMTKFFKEKFFEKYNYFPSTPSYLTFDAYYLLYNAIKNCVKDDKIVNSENINYYVRHTKNLLATTGLITINPKTGNPNKPVYVLKFENGKPAFVKKIIFTKVGE